MARRATKKAIGLVLGRPDREARRESFLAGRLEVASARGVRGPERVLLLALDQEVEGRVLVVGTREGLAALAIARLFPSAEVHLLGMDAYELERARETLARNSAEVVRCRLGADLPDPGGFDWVVLPVRHAGDAMLTGELLREAHRVLKDRGKLLAGTDNPRDRWLHDQILEVFGAATIHQRHKRGTAYVARKQPGSRVRERNYHRRFRARLLGREIELETRPGVFSHGELDQGTLALAEAAVLREDSRVLDLGCGSGAIGIAAALAAPRGAALLIDSSARAALAARSNAVRNGVERNTLVVLSHDLRAAREASFDIALANPPYFADHRITGHFASGARRALAPGGELLLVTRSPDVPYQIIHGLFGRAEAETKRGYSVIRARKG